MFSNKNQSCHRFLVHVAQTDVRNSLGFTRLQIDPGLRFRLNFAPLGEGLTRFPRHHQTPARLPVDQPDKSEFSAAPSCCLFKGDQ